MTSNNTPRPLLVETPIGRVLIAAGSMGLLLFVLVLIFGL